MSLDYSSIKKEELIELVRLRDAHIRAFERKVKHLDTVLFETKKSLHKVAKRYDNANQELSRIKKYVSVAKQGGAHLDTPYN
jgi:hypothetical protein